MGQCYPVSTGKRQAWSTLILVAMAAVRSALWMNDIICKNHDDYWYHSFSYCDGDWDNHHLWLSSHAQEVGSIMKEFSMEIQVQLV